MAKAAKIACLSCGQANRIPADKLAAGPKCGTCGARLADGKVTEIDPGALAKAARLDEVPLIVDFWAPWCGPCRMMAPEFAKAAAEMRGEVRFAKINTEEFQNVSMKHNIRGIPALVLFQGGREVARLAGARPAADIIRFLRENIRALA